MMILNAYFESQDLLNNSDEARQQFSQRQLQNDRFLYGDPVMVLGRSKVFFRFSLCGTSTYCFSTEGQVSVSWIACHPEFCSSPQHN
jgi:hypothetical protein